MTLFRYGTSGTVRLDVAEDVLVGDFTRPKGRAIDDVTAATQQAVSKPLGFPPLAQAIVPGDRVSIAVAPEVPCATSIVAVVVAELLSNGVAAEDISILRANDGKSANEDLTGEVPNAARTKLHVVDHDPNDREKLSYLAASDEAKPIYLNRLITDADLVVTIGCQRAPESLGYHGVSSTLFPTFSDAKTVQRYRSPAVVESPVQQKRLQRQADQARWLLGAPFAVQVVPGADDEVLHVVAGDVEAVRKQATELCAKAWSHEAPQRADLVVASVTGEPGQQSWENVARALAAAMRVVNAEGAIAICTDLEQRPGPAMQYLASAEDREQAVREIVKEQPADALPAVQLMHALQNGPVYLLSRLDETLVEELGMAAITDADQIARLTKRAHSCILLADAQFAVPTAREKSTQAARS